MMWAMSERFEYWRQAQGRLATELRGESKLLFTPPAN
jgi:hypothetical protein